MGEGWDGGLNHIMANAPAATRSAIIIGIAYFNSFRTPDNDVNVDAPVKLTAI